MSFDLEGWILSYRRPDLDEVCYAGGFETPEAAWAYAATLPPDRYDKGVSYGRLEFKLKDQAGGS